MTDAEFVALLRAGQSAAGLGEYLEEMYTRPLIQRSHSLYRSFRIGGVTPEELAEETVHDYFVQVIKDELDIEQPLAYMMTMLFNKYCTLKRKGRFFSPYPINMNGDHAEMQHTEGALVQRLYAEGILAYMKVSHPKEWKLLYLRYIIGLKPRQIARLFNTKPGTISVYLAHAKKYARAFTQKNPLT